MTQKVLIFGSNGTIGDSIFIEFEKEKYEVYTAGKSNNKKSINHINTNYSLDIKSDAFKELPEFDAIIWAHGLNLSDTIENFKFEDLSNLLNSNVIFIASCISNLLRLKKIKKGGRLVVVSSIWQLESRKNKFSYSVSKSALQGLIKSSAIDLGRRNILINAVLPGVVDSPMTRMHLSEKQIKDVIEETALCKLTMSEDIAKATSFLASPHNKSITGQFLIVDGGFLGLKNNF